MRHREIDLLRGIAIMVMVLIHANAYFLSDKIAFYLWDLSQFAVPVFIFCASYVFFKKNHQFKTSGDLFFYLKRRIIRLLVPYYLFAIIFIFLVYLKEPQKVNLSYLWQNFLVVGGIDINWLVLLFLIFSFLMPLTLWLVKKSWLFYLYSAISLLSAVWLIFFPFPFNYRLIMWLPWSLIVVFSWYFVRYEKSRRFLPGGFFIFLGIFVGLRFLEAILRRSLTMYDNKYPPNLYHLSYGVFFIIILFYLAQRGVFNFLPVKKLLNFLSINSYPLYFVHYLVIFIVTVFFKPQLNWLSFFGMIFFITVAGQFLLNKLCYLFSTLYKGPTI